MKTRHTGWFTRVNHLNESRRALERAARLREVLFSQKLSGGAPCKLLLYLSPSSRASSFIIPTDVNKTAVVAFPSLYELQPFPACRFHSSALGFFPAQCVTRTPRWDRKGARSVMLFFSGHGATPLSSLSAPKAFHCFRLLLPTDDKVYFSSLAADGPTCCVQGLDRRGDLLCRRLSRGLCFGWRFVCPSFLPISKLARHAVHHPHLFSARWRFSSKRG